MICYIILYSCYKRFVFKLRLQDCYIPLYSYTRFDAAFQLHLNVVMFLSANKKFKRAVDVISTT